MSFIVMRFGVIVALNIEMIVVWYLGTADGGTVLQIGRSQVRFQMVSLKFFIDITIPIELWPWGRLSL
jgi:hypothetical protein